MDLSKVIGLGVAGNFAGHLEQAGEAKDFLNVKVNEAQAPKALFPFYLPNPQGDISSSFLKVYPLTDNVLVAPCGEGDNLQVEPEIGVIFDIIYEGERVVNLIPKFFGAYNDSSIRRAGAKKISEKKNWGEGTKGFAGNLLAIDEFTADSLISNYRICCYLKRDNKLIAYGVDSSARDYSYMYEKLIGWMIEKMNNQKDEGPAENIHNYLLACNKPEQMLVSIGATRYTEFGQHNYLTKGDVSIVIVYPEDLTVHQIEQMIEKEDWSDTRVSALIQKVV